MEPNDTAAKDQILLKQYMIILFLLVSFLSILGLFLLSKIYWKDSAVGEIQKNSNVASFFCHNVHEKHNVTQFDKNFIV